MGTKRIYSLDFVKLVAIYLVLWGHCIQSLIPEVGSGEGKPVFLYIYSFHMSLSVSYTHLTLPTILRV